MIPAKSTPAEILHAVLLSLNIIKPANSALWPCFVENLPDAPDNASVIYDTTPILQGRYMETGEIVRKPGVQIMVRARIPDRSSGWELIVNISNAFEQSIKRSALACTQTIKGITYRVENASISSGPVSLGQEKEGTRRFLFTVNARLTIVKVS